MTQAVVRLRFSDIQSVEAEDGNSSQRSVAAGLAALAGSGFSLDPVGEALRPPKRIHQQQCSGQQCRLV